MPRRSHDDRQSGIVRLVLIAGTAAAVWLLVLPWVGRWGPVRDFVESNEAAGINPSAVYYTEVEAMGGISERLSKPQTGQAIDPGVNGLMRKEPPR